VVADKAAPKKSWSGWQAGFPIRFERLLAPRNAVGYEGFLNVDVNANREVVPGWLP
jgi:hypothetical protein